jgi:hypothetical protein
MTPAMRDMFSDADLDAGFTDENLKSSSLLEERLF